MYQRTIKASVLKARVTRTQAKEAAVVAPKGPKLKKTGHARSVVAGKSARAKSTGRSSDLRL